MTSMPTLFLSHGAPPLVDDERWVAQLKAWAADLPRPEAILVVSAHWESAPLTIGSTVPGTPLTYDFGGFPARYYQTTYDSPVAPDLAQKVAALMPDDEAVTSAPHRRLDHGAYVPLTVMYPDAEVPVLQLSIVDGYDPEAHLAVGRAIAPLRDEGVLIVGSGLSYHNLREFGPTGAAPSAAFDGWLRETLVESDPAERVRRLLDWEAAPGGRRSHPAEDHLIPLMVAVGAAEADPATQVHHEEDAMGGGIHASSYAFGLAA